MKNNIILHALGELGLSNHEARLYLRLVLDSSPSITELANELGIERRTVYRALRRLTQLGLAQQGKRYSRVINVEPPSKVISLLRQRQTLLRDLGKSMTELLPDLLTEYHKGARQPRVRFYETPESFMALLDEIVDECNDNLYMVGSTTVLDVFPEYMETFIRRRARKGSYSLTISFQNPKLARRDHVKEFRKLKIVPAQFNADAAYMAWSNKVAIWNTSLPRIVVVEDKIIFSLFKTIFDMLWEKY